VRRIRLIWYLFPFFLLITLVVMAGVTWYAARSWRTFFLQQTVTDLETRARLLEGRLSGPLTAQDGPWIDRLCKDLGQTTATRLTVILPSGVVLGDSAENPAKMDNHADRPEFQAAVNTGAGVSTRYSFTLGHRRLYAAVPIKHRGTIVGVIRASLPMTAIDRALRSLYYQIALGGVLIALLVAALSLAISRRLTRPLEDLQRGARRFAQGELQRKLPIPQSEELANLAEAFNEMAAQLENRLSSLARQGQLQQAVLSSMIEGVVALDSNQRIISLNQAGAALLGISPESAENQRLQDVVPDAQLRWFCNRTLAAAEPVEEEINFNDGNRILRAHGTSLLTPEGNAIGTLIVLDDVTHLRQLERTRRDFVANVSHELKTPITSIKGFVETLLGGAINEPENAKNFLEIIARQTERLNEIIDDLLSLSRIEQDEERGQIFLTNEYVKSPLAEAIKVCAPKARAKDIQVSLICPDQLRARINAPLLEQAVVNLVDNAIKYSNAGSSVTVMAQPAGAEIVICVQDQGRGIAKEHLPRLFERFYRADSGRTRKLGGSGLGLAIVKHIVQAHGGRITVESSPGQGSVFAMHLKPV
jgi:two-component system, OmpR family, phosphate regulon sensor histidine kinase PhoR